MKQKQSRWKFKDADSSLVENLVQTTNISKVFATILVQRGIYTLEEMEDFFNPRLQNMHPPELMADMDKAVERIAQAIKDKETIFTYGDYDVDGVTSTSLLYQCLRLLGASVDFYLPHRTNEGYGLNIEAIDLLKEKGAKLIITIDCGIRGFEPIRHAQANGIDVIVTDHHEIADEKIPEAYAVVNPKDKRGKYPFPSLAGVGVAFKLSWALCQKFSPESEAKVLPKFRQFLLDSMSFVAVGTIADMVPLTDENRIFARYGLLAFEKSSNEGIKALKEIAKLSQIRPITPQHISFRIAPLINAMGRMQHSRFCVELLTCDDENKAMELARKLDVENKRRRRIQVKIHQEALKQIEEKRYQERSAFVLASEKWHVGVLGIVASRILDSHYRPTCVISINEKTKIGKASARSIPGFNMFAALQKCQEHLIDFGGHEMAAGFQIEKSKIHLLRRDLEKIAEETLSEEELISYYDIDAEIQLDEINWDLIHKLDKLSPFGQGNPSPLFASKNVEVIMNPPPGRVGDKGDHLSFHVRQNGATYKAISFGKGKSCDEMISKKKCSLVFSLIRNVWHDRDNIELEVKDIRFDDF